MDGYCPFWFGGGAELVSRRARITVMTAIEIRVNGKKQCVAGIPDGTVAVSVSCTGRTNGRKKDGGYLFLHVDGLDSERDEHVDWMGRDDFAIGDEIVLRFVDAPKTDSPKKRKPAEEHRKARKDFVRRIARELVWKIQTE